MGSWGAKLYQDDLAQDIKEDYREKLRKGRTNKEALEEMIERYAEEIEDDDEGPVFWMLLADTMWNLGRLIPEVKEKAIQQIDEGKNLEIWKQEGTQKEYELRKSELNKLKEKLNSPMPEEKRIPLERKIPAKRKYEWNIGDTYAYELKGDKAEELGLKGRYLILRKVEDVDYIEQKIIAIVYCQITEDTVLPKTKAELEKLSYTIQMNKGDIRYAYKIRLGEVTQKALKEELIYIGNFTEMSCPPNEFKERTLYDITYYPYKELEYFILQDYEQRGTSKNPILYNWNSEDEYDDEIRYLMREKYYKDALEIEQEDSKEAIEYLATIDAIIIRMTKPITEEEKEQAYEKIKQLEDMITTPNQEEKLNILEDLKKRIQEYVYKQTHCSSLEEYLAKLEKNKEE